MIRCSIHINIGPQGRNKNKVGERLPIADDVSSSQQRQRSRKHSWLADDTKQWQLSLLFRLLCETFPFEDHLVKRFESLVQPFSDDRTGRLYVPKVPRAKFM